MHIECYLHDEVPEEEPLTDVVTDTEVVPETDVVPGAGQEAWEICLIYSVSSSKTNEEV